METIELKRTDGSVIASIEASSFQDAMKDALSRGISLEKIDISDVTFKTVDFTGVNLAGSHFSNVCFETVDFTGANCSESLFKNCTFVEVDTMKMDISDTSFDHCVFKDTAFVYVKGYDSEKFIGCSYKDCI